MLIAEARWLAERIFSLEPELLRPMLNVGSSTNHFRTVEQPWIDRCLFQPARERGLTIATLDLRDEPGVDIVGDICDPATIRDLRQMRFRSVLCSNLLEHVAEPREVGRSIVHILPVGGFIFASCPYRYPRHNDPIDTMYRPNAVELAASFVGTRVVDATVVTCGSYLDYQIFLSALWPHFADSTQEYDATRAARGSSRIPHFLRQLIWLARNLPWLFRGYEATCAVLRKT